MRAERQRDAREQAAYIAKLEKRAGHKLSKRERAAEMRRFGSKHRREMEEARRKGALLTTGPTYTATACAQ